MIENETLGEYVRESVASVFTIMLRMEISGGAFSVEHSPPVMADGVLAFVGMAGPLTGTGSVRCSSRFAHRIRDRLLMTDDPAGAVEVLDAVGEVANMIIGGFKTSIEDHVGPLGLSIPTVIFGRNFTSRSVGGGKWIVQRFLCEGEEFETRICLSQTKPLHAHGLSHAHVVLA